ncbi:unnamed protein product [Rotaria sp. Silwood1]|nr:unnamed protein product [Rotaria sp. Silwood1]CAF3381390.1 unnamed protein product [Rotaria sp. Silwood1]CAF3386313.1 unnamed protein product [Rotaria sp. Silwood1]CAF4648354.1 unnamed protein product [Rotaria sp. Silwood1]CAF4664624.1 unnamed protein product [Rotaria sp. Silwood1]
MVHFSQSLMPDVPLATSLPTTFTFHPNNQIDDQSSLQQQSLPTSTQSQLNSSLSNQQQRSSPNDDRATNINHQTHTNDYETRLRCPNCETWVVNLSDHLRKTHRIASPVDRKPLLRMARLEKRRMTESANNSSSSSSTTTILKVQSTSTLVDNGLSTPHANTHEIENLLFKHEHDANTLSNQQFSVTIPENILLNQQMTNSIAQYSSSNKRQRTLDDHLEHTSNGPLSPNKKTRIGILDPTKLSQTTHLPSNKSNKKNRNKPQQQQQQQQSQPQTIIKTAASGIFPQQQLPQTVTIQNIDESSDDLSKVLQMMGNEMNFLNQHLQTTSILLQKQLDLARDSLHACSVQFARNYFYYLSYN